MNSTHIYNVCILSVCFLVITENGSSAQDSVSFDGQLSLWIHYHPAQKLPLSVGGRYIPQLNLRKSIDSSRILDLEISGNAFGSLTLSPFDTIHSSGLLKAYRAWIRFSSDQFELRLGLQKISFGSSTMLRPLMWFDQLDPRDPLQLTDGVWGLLGRYYFLNNANIWLWGLWGNQEHRGWELVESSKRYPEFGGRLQWPVPRGEAAVSYHHRTADSRGLAEFMPSYAKIPENRIGIDARWDLKVGLWLEATWSAKNRNLGIFKNQEIITLGTDYTFNIGNGLTVILEHALLSYDEHPFEFSRTTSLTGLSASCPVSILDILSGLVYIDWKNKSTYNFITWQRKYDRIVLYLMAYWNPENYMLPVQETSSFVFTGKGIQFMFVYNH